MTKSLSKRRSSASQGRRARHVTALNRAGALPGFGVGIATPDYAYAEVSPAVAALAAALAKRPDRRRSIDHAA
jgi:hypothetical protein